MLWSVGRFTELTRFLPRLKLMGFRAVTAVTATEAALDIGGVLLGHERGRSPASNAETMRALGEVGVLTESTAAEMANAARFRNVLAHTYGDAIDHDIVYDALRDLHRYRSFVQEVRTYLTTIGAL